MLNSLRRYVYNNNNTFEMLSFHTVVTLKLYSNVTYYGF